MTGKEIEQAAVTLSGRHRHMGGGRVGAFRWLAAELKVHPSTVFRWVNGTHRPPEWAVETIKDMLLSHRFRETA